MVAAVVVVGEGEVGVVIGGVARAGGVVIGGGGGELGKGSGAPSGGEVGRGGTAGALGEEAEGARGRGRGGVPSAQTR